MLILRKFARRGAAVLCAKGYRDFNPPGDVKNHMYILVFYHASRSCGHDISYRVIASCFRSTSVARSHGGVRCGQQQLPG